MKLDIEIRCVENNTIINISTDDVILVSTLLPIIQPRIPLLPTKWDLAFGEIRLLPNRTLQSYSVYDGATLWVSPRPHSLEDGVYPLTLIFKESGKPCTITMKFASNYTITECKNELLAALGVQNRAIGLLLYQRKKEERMMVTANACGDLNGAVEMEEKKTLGSYNVVDREVMVYKFDKTVMRRALMATARATGGVVERVHFMKEEVKEGAKTGVKDGVNKLMKKTTRKLRLKRSQDENLTPQDGGDTSNGDSLGREVWRSISNTEESDTDTPSEESSEDSVSSSDEGDRAQVSEEPVISIEPLNLEGSVEARHEEATGSQANNEES